jgi:hypothetical protein
MSINRRYGQTLVASRLSARLHSWQLTPGDRGPGALPAGLDLPDALHQLWAFILQRAPMS